MNILILTAKFGLGHYKAAENVKEKILEENIYNKVYIVDFFQYVFPDLYKTIYATFNLLVDKCPVVYNMFNMLSLKNNPVPFKKVVLEKIDSLISDNQIDEIISVVPICSEYISTYIDTTGSLIKLNTMITDIEVHDLWLNKNTTRYFVPSIETRNYLLNKGVFKEKIIVSGIPVNSNFNIESVFNHKKRILIMGGGLGLIPNIDKFLSFFNENKNVLITVIVGNDKKLFERLSKKYKNINLIGYTNEVYKYMNKADLLITKPGGITLFEAIQTETPLFIIKPFLVQEKGNAKFIEKMNIGKIIWNNKKDIYNEVISLFNNETELNIMRNNMHFLKYSINDIDFTSIFSRVGEVC